MINSGVHFLVYAPMVHDHTVAFYVWPLEMSKIFNIISHFFHMCDAFNVLGIILYKSSL